MKSISGDAEGLFEFGGKFREVARDFRWLVGQSGGHALQHFRFGTKHLDSEHDEGKMIIDVVAHLGKFQVQLFNLLRTQRDGMVGCSHGETMWVS